MTAELTPGTDWTERVAADEAERFAGYARQFAAIQARKSRKYGTGRALHRKQITAGSGFLQVLDDLPDFARQGLFAQPATFDVRVRLSNGGFDRAPDRMPTASASANARPSHGVAVTAKSWAASAVIFWSPNTAVPANTTTSATSAPTYTR